MKLLCGDNEYILTYLGSNLEHRGTRYYTVVSTSMLNWKQDPDGACTSTGSGWVGAIFSRILQRPHIYSRMVRMFQSVKIALKLCHSRSTNFACFVTNWQLKFIFSNNDGMPHTLFDLSSREGFLEENRLSNILRSKFQNLLMRLFDSFDQTN